jgi:hypothetical protein
MGVTTGTTNKSYVSAQDWIDTREINPALIDAANDTGFLKTMQLFGRTKKTSQPSYSHHVNSEMYAAITVGTTTGSGTPTVTTALTAGNGFLRVSDTVSFPDGNQGVVYSKSTTSGVDTLVIKATDGSNLTLVSGNSLTFSGYGVGEESDSVANRRYDTTRHFNLIQTFREIDVITDIQKVSTVEFTYNGQNLYGVYQHARKLQALRSAIDIAMIQGRQSVTQYGDSSPALTDANGKPLQFTMGLDQYVTTYGVNDSLATTGTLTFADLKDFSQQLNAAKAPLDFMGYTSDSSKIVYDTFFKGIGSSGITSGRMNLDGKDIDLTVDKYTFGSRTYELVPVKIFDHPKVISSSIKNSIYWIPKGKVNVEGGGMEPRIQIRYMDHSMANGNDNMIGEAHSGLLAPNPNGTIANWSTHWLTHQGLEVLAANQCAKQTVTF